MYDNIYYCRNAENTCPKKNTCLRYLDATDQPVATLFKCSCTDKNNYQVYILKEQEKENAETDNTEQSSN